MKMVVLGAGSWGTAFAGHLAKCGHEVLLWGRNKEFMEKLEENRENKEYLIGIEIPQKVSFTSDLLSLEEFGEVVFIAVPSEAVEDLMTKLKNILPSERLNEVTWVSLVKGLKFDNEEGIILTMSDVVRKILGQDKKVLVLSGPSHAEEVSREIPTNVILAGNSGTLAPSSYDKARKLSKKISNSYFRVYTRREPGSIEICGGVKNPLAIGAGIARGLGKYGDNALAALVCRGANEIAHLLDALGFSKEPVSGLAGVGDLIATCGSKHSRNYRHGMAVGRGEAVEPGTIDGMVVEGYYAVKQIMLIKKRVGVEMPISEQVYKVLYKDKDPEIAIEDLMERDYKEEVPF